MAAGPARSTDRYPNLLVTIDRAADGRFVKEIYSNSHYQNFNATPRSRPFHTKNIYYYSNGNNNNNRRRPQSHRPPSYQLKRSNCLSSDRIPTLINVVDDHDRSPPPNEHQPLRRIPQRGQYRNRKAELDWDHTFDLDQSELFINQNESDNRSLTSVTSSSDQSFISN